MVNVVHSRLACLHFFSLVIASAIDFIFFGTPLRTCSSRWKFSISMSTSLLKKGTNCDNFGYCGGRRSFGLQVWLLHWMTEVDDLALGGSGGGSVTGKTLSVELDEEFNTSTKSSRVEENLFLIDDLGGEETKDGSEA